MKKITQLILFSLWFLPNFLAQQDDLQAARKWVYEGYINNDLASWQKGQKALWERFQRDGGRSLELAYEALLAEYGMIGYCLANENCQDIADRVDNAQEKIEEVLDIHSKWSEGHAFLGGLLAMEIELSPARAIFLGPSSSKHISAATELNPNNPSGWVEMGNMKYHAPALFGGDTEEAIEYFKKAIQLFDNQPQLRKNNWLYLHAWVWLAKSYEEEEKLDLALATYKRLLAYEPRFRWVKDELYPDLLKKMNG